MEKSLYGYILRHSLPKQVIVTLMAMGSFPFLYAFYELPKQIVNSAIQGKPGSFPTEFLGYQFDQVPYLFLLCGLFLALVLANQGFKYVINVYRGLLGERMLRRLRYDLYSRVLRFPQSTFRKLSQGEIIQMINAEVEPLGGFIGDAFSLPAFQGGTLVVIFSFVLYQDVYLAAAAVMFYPLQFYLIPKLQRRVNMMAKRRVQLVRQLSDRIGETVAGAQDIHVHNTAGLELAQFSRRLGSIFDVRLQIYVWKFIIKFINNTINQLGPFFFYSIGGYMVIIGRFELGTLVAVLAANKDLAAPWKELLNYYQRREDARIKYDQVVEQFEPAGMMDDALQMEEPEEVKPLAGEVAAASLSLQDDLGHALIDGATFAFGADKHVAVVGGGGSGKDELVLMLARLIEPSAGTVSIGGAKLAELPEAVTGRRLSYVGSHAVLFSTSVRENLVYGLKHTPLVAADYDETEAKAQAGWLNEAAASGNFTADLNADWVDYAAAGANDKESLDRRLMEVLDVVDLAPDIYTMGLRGRLDPKAHPELAARILEGRANFMERLYDPQIASLVEVFDAEKYNDNATVGENLLFGSPVGNEFDVNRLAENDYVLKVLNMTSLTDRMMEAGRQVASTMVELFADLPPGHEFFDQFSFISHEDLPEYQALLNRVERDGMGVLEGGERTMLLSLPFRLSPARHRLGVVDDDFKARLLKARRVFADNLPAELKGAVAHFDVNAYNAALSIQDNILFGKVAYGQAEATERIGAIVAEVMDGLELRGEVMGVGLDFQVGIGGSRLNSGQRQKLAIARAVIKRPDVLILNEATATLDGAAQARVMAALIKEFDGRGLVWALHRPSLSENFDHVLVMQGGKIVEQGTFDQLSASNGALKELIAAE